MRALEHDAQTLSAQARALQAAQQALDLAQTSYRAGALDYLSLLTAQVQYQTARIAYVRAQAQRYQDTSALFLALGGDWREPAAVPTTVAAGREQRAQTQEAK